MTLRLHGVCRGQLRPLLYMPGHQEVAHTADAIKAVHLCPLLELAWDYRPLCAASLGSSLQLKRLIPVLLVLLRNSSDSTRTPGGSNGRDLHLPCLGQPAFVPTQLLIRVVAQPEAPLTLACSLGPRGNLGPCSLLFTSTPSFLEMSAP